MPTNEILPFATGGGADVTDLANYKAALGTARGILAGIALPKRVNRALRQMVFPHAGLGEFIKTVGGYDVLDNNDVDTVATHLAASVLAWINLYNFPAGFLFPYAATALPAGKLLVDGGVLAQAAQPRLYAAIGDTFNTGGEGAGNFRKPDLRGRTPIGLDTMITAADRFNAAVLGAQLGEQLHILLDTEFPPHPHAAGVEVPHHHAMAKLYVGAGGNLFNPGPQAGSLGTGGKIGYIPNTAGPLSTTANTPLTMVPSGGNDEGHNNVQPSIAFIWGITT